MDFLDDAQVEEQITIYENKIKAVKEKIKSELQVRRDLKAKLDEAKKRESAQILILERLDEYEKLVNKQLETAEKMEDVDSMKELTTIEKYENMLNNQKEVWIKYEEEYEQLPLAKQTRQAEIRLMKVDIQNKVVYFKIEETKRMIKMKKKIDKRMEQIKIIEMAKLYLDYKKREKRSNEIMENIKDLKQQEKELRFEIQKIEKKIKEQEEMETIKKETIKATLPQIDIFSHYVKRKDVNNDNLDTMSINSYMLEQEYMNNSEDSQEDQQKSNKSALQSKNLEKDMNENSMGADTILVSHNSEEQPDPLNQPEQLNMKNDDQLDKRDRHINFNPQVNVFNSENQPLQMNSLHKSNNFKQTNKNDILESNLEGSKHNSQENQSQSFPTHMFGKTSQESQSQSFPTQILKKSSQENQSESQSLFDKNVSKKRGTNKNRVINNDPSCFPSNDMQLISSPRKTKGRLIPSPAKIPKNSSQKQIQQQQMHQQQQQIYQQQQQQQQKLMHQQQQMYQQQQQQQQMNQQQQQQMHQQKQQQLNQLQQQQLHHQQQQTHQLQQQQRHHQQQQTRQLQQQQMHQQQQIQKKEHYDAQQQRQLQQQNQMQIQQQQRQMQLQQQQEQTSMQQPIENESSMNFTMDLSRLPMVNKPQIKSIEHVNYQNLQKQFPQMMSRERSSNNQQTIPMEISDMDTTMETPQNQGIPIQMQQDRFPNQGPITPMSRESVMSIAPSSMMSTAMHSTITPEPNMYADNISAILGSEITEPGGSFELARRLYGYADSDLNSEDGFNLDNMDKFFSPIVTNTRDQEQDMKVNNEFHENPNPEPPKLNEQNNTNFNFGQFVKKPSAAKPFF